MLWAMAVSAFMVLLTVAVHFEALNLLTKFLARHKNWGGRKLTFITIIGVFCAHTLEIWLFAVAYFALTQIGLGGLGTVVEEAKGFEYLYYSTVSYTSLGLGDLYPHGAMRLVTGVEALVGLLMIGWSASFTYITMEKFWKFQRN